MGDILVDRSSAVLRQPGGELYRPKSDGNPLLFAELVAGDVTRQVLAQSRDARHPSVQVLRIDRLSETPQSLSFDLGNLGRDFDVAIKRANATDLVSRGPLDLKSTDVVPPQIVVDAEVCCSPPPYGSITVINRDRQGLLAVFTGRGCGAARDVNFFRPAYVCLVL